MKIVLIYVCRVSKCWLDPKLWVSKVSHKKVLTRRGSGVCITDSPETLGYVFGCRNMKKAVILDPNAKKNKVLGTLSFILKKALKKIFP